MSDERLSPAVARSQAIGIGAVTRTPGQSDEDYRAEIDKAAAWLVSELPKEER